MVKLVAIDLDGTLFNSRSVISRKNRKAISACLDRGVRVVITTAKTVYWVKKLITSLNLKDPQIASAGAAIIDANLNPLYIKKIPAVHYRKMVALARKHEVGFCASCLDGFVYHENDNPSLEYVWETKERPKRVINLLSEDIASQVLLITVTVDNDHIFNEILREELKNSVKIRRGGHNFLAAYNNKTGKTAALKKIMNDMKIKDGDVMAIGDSESDLGMIKLAGFGVAMGNAPENVKNAACYVAGDNDNDGVAEAIDKFVLKRKNT